MKSSNAGPAPSGALADAKRTASKPCAFAASAICDFSVPLEVEIGVGAGRDEPGQLVGE